MIDSHEHRRLLDSSFDLTRWFFMQTDHIKQPFCDDIENMVLQMIKPREFTPKRLDLRLA